MSRHGPLSTFRAVARRPMEFLGAFSLTVFTTVFINDNLYEITSITGTSMHPTLSPTVDIDGKKDAVIWSKWDPIRNLKRGDVVLFDTPHDPNRVSVKRVVALEGDTVILDPRRRPRDAENGRKNVDARLWDIRYANGKGKVMIPEGHVWIEGDNRRETRDSNAYGPISKALIKGKAVGLFWPLNQMGSKPWESYKITTKVIEGVPPRSIKNVDDSNGWWEAH